MHRHLHYPSPLYNHQPRPRFCIFRPGGLLAPLIPIDELPAWLQISNWTPDMFMGLQPVSLSYIPREGEYDVICHHCSSSVDSLHQSLSERNEDSPQSTDSQTKSCPGAFVTGPIGEAPSTMPNVPYQVPYQLLGQPPFHATLQNPFLGLYMFEMPGMPGMPTNVTGSVPLEKLQNFVPSRSSSTESLQSETQQSVCGLPKTGPGTGTPATSVDLRENDTLPDLSPDTQKKISQVIAASLCSVEAAESIASTRSLTAMVEHLKRHMAEKGRSSKPGEKYVIAGGTNSNLPHTQGKSKKSRARSGAQRQTKGRRRRRRRAKNTANIVSRVDNARGPGNPEQVNSSTKRRDRRERMDRQKEMNDSGGQYWHMMMVPSKGSGAPHR